MKTCPNCNASVEDNAAFCPSCGANLGGPQPQPNNQQFQNGYGANQGGQYYGYAPVDPYDHTMEFDPKDISENKVIAMLVYLLGVVGIFIALFASHDSKYVSFHVRQSLKFLVVEVLLLLCAVVFCWTFIVPIVFGVIIVVLLVVKIICFVQICQGKAKEPYIIRSLGFLK